MRATEPTRYRLDPDRPGTRLPGLVWEQLDELKARARAHPDGIIDLSHGGPVDPVPEPVREALASGADAHGYPTTRGRGPLRRAAVDWMARRLGVTGISPDQVLPVLGSRELLVGLPAQLGIGADAGIALPDLGYPSYGVAARLARARAAHYRGNAPTADLPPVRLAYLNSPRNPTGGVASLDELRGAVAWARANGVILVSDECYVEFGWSARAFSILAPEVCDGSTEGLLAVHTMSKRSSMAGYRAGFVTGDPHLISELLAVRKVLGVVVPLPIQTAMTAALRDDRHVDLLRERYAHRRDRLRDAFRSAGWRVPEPDGGLYLWISHPNLTGWQSVEFLSGMGILATPGEFYGPTGKSFARVALTVTDENVEAAVLRLKAPATHLVVPSGARLGKRSPSDSPVG